MNNKHAYLLMLHHRKDLVDLLIEELDHPLNDLFIHIDVKSTELTEDDIKTKHSNVYFVKPMSVNWGGYSQVRCEFSLMRKAYEKGPYAYYHLMQGSSFPLRTQDQIHQFFKENDGKNFISCDDGGYYERVAHIYLFSEHSFPRKNIDYTLFKIENKLQQFQTRINFDRFKKYNMEFKKGFALWSLNNDAIKYLLDNERKTHRIFRYSLSGDEIAIQTMLYNSRFKDTLYRNQNGSTICLWFSTWGYEQRGLERPRHNFKFEDLNDLLNCGMFFARKFEGEDGHKLIEAIKIRLHG